jgi:hypothetical protein
VELGWRRIVSEVQSTNNAEYSYPSAMGYAESTRALSRKSKKQFRHSPQTFVIDAFNLLSSAAYRDTPIVQVDTVHPDRQMLFSVRIT